MLIAFPVCLMAQYKPIEKEKSKNDKKAEKKERVNKLIKQEEEGMLIFQKQNIFGFKLYSDGWAALYEKGIMKTVDKTTLFMAEFGEHKSNKEHKQPNVDQNGISFGNSFIYGKVNNFFFLKLGVGQSILLGGKGNKNGVAVSAIYGGGLSLGLLKPYYVKILDVNSKEQKIKYGENAVNDSLFLYGPFTGGAGVFKGFNEPKVKPGVFVKGALRFDYGKYNETVSAIEAGFNAEYYTSSMPIMAIVKAKKLFLNVFIAIEFGKRK